MQAPDPASLTQYLGKVTTGSDLTSEEAQECLETIISGDADPLQVAGLLAGLQAKGLSPAEVAGGVRALQTAMVSVASEDVDLLVDTCGTGGGSVTTFNISTASAIVAAGGGVTLAKHGNRSFTSKSGSADVLESLGVEIQLTPEAMAEILQETGIVFMFAPLLHPAMRHVAAVRKALGVRTMMNLLGPLTNPAGAQRQVVGVAEASLLDLVTGALQELGHHRALVVHGQPGMDEISPCGPTEIAELKAGEVHRYTVTPEDLGLEPVSPEDLAGGEPQENAMIVERVIRGEERGAPRSAVLANAGAAFYVADRANSLHEGVAEAAASIDSGAAARKLESLIAASRKWA